MAAISALEIPISSYVEGGASLVVSGSKEVREKAGHIVEAAFASFQPLLERIAVTGSSDERYHAVRVLGKLGGLYARNVIGIPIHADRVTLSACRGAGSRTYAGEGLVSFA